MSKINREKFETWYLENRGHTEDNHETLFERSPDDEYEYYRIGVRMDHQAWQAGNKASESQLTALTSQLESIVAENAALKAAESNLVRNIINDLGDTEFQYEKVQTPVTDAFLAEVRASGVEMAACALDDVNQFNYANMLDDLAHKLH